MLTEGKPDLVIVFPGGRGTANMVSLARNTGIKVIEFMKKVSIAAGLALATVSFVALLGAETIQTPRMPYSESSAIKRSMIPPGHTMSEYELDHIVPLCLDGSNNSSNLQLQPWAEARKKDTLEVDVCRMVRAGRLNIDAARALFTNWRTSYKEVYGVEP